MHVGSGREKEMDRDDLVDLWGRRKWNGKKSEVVGRRCGKFKGRRQRCGKSKEGSRNMGWKAGGVIRN